MSDKIRVERVHAYTAWVPNVSMVEARAEVAAEDGGVWVTIDDGGEELHLTDHGAAALYYALRSWLRRRGASENEEEA